MAMDKEMGKVFPFKYANSFGIKRNDATLFRLASVAITFSSNSEKIQTRSNKKFKKKYGLCTCKTTDIRI